MTRRTPSAGSPFSPGVRVLLVLLVVGGQIGLLVWYGSLGPAPEAGAYPDAGDLATDYEAYVGERVSLRGTVVGTDPVVVETAGATGLTLTVRALSGTAAVGETLRVFAVVEPDGTLRAIDGVLVARPSLRYTYVVSFVAGLWALARLVRHWRVDGAQRALVPRAETAGSTDEEPAREATRNA